MLEPIFNQINKMYDSKWSWYPFLNLKPKKDQLITFRHNLRYTAQYGLLYFVVLFAMAAIAFANGRRPLGIQNLWDWVLYSFIVFLIIVFLGYQLVIAPAWNYRARKLRKVKNDEVTTE